MRVRLPQRIKNILGLALVLVLLLLFQNCGVVGFEVNNKILDYAQTEGTSQSSVELVEDLQRLVSVSFPVSAIKSGNRLVLTKGGEVYIEDSKRLRLQTVVYANPLSFKDKDADQIKLTLGSSVIPTGWVSLTQPPNKISEILDSGNCPIGYKLFNDGEIQWCELENTNLVKYPSDGYCQYNNFDCQSRLVPDSKDPDCSTYQSPVCPSDSKILNPNFENYAGVDFRILNREPRTTSTGNSVPGIILLQFQKQNDSPQNFESINIEENLATENAQISLGSKVPILDLGFKGQYYYNDEKVFPTEGDSLQISCADGSSPVQKSLGGMTWGECTPQVEASQNDKCPNRNYTLKTKKVELAKYSIPTLKASEANYCGWWGCGSCSELPVKMGYSSATNYVVLAKEGIFSSQEVGVYDSGSPQYLPMGTMVTGCKMKRCDVPAGTAVSWDDSRCITPYPIFVKEYLGECPAGMQLHFTEDNGGKLEIRSTGNIFNMVVTESDFGLGNIEFIESYPELTKSGIATCMTNTANLSCPDGTYTKIGSTCVKKYCEIADQSPPQKNGLQESFQFEDSIAKNANDEQGPFPVGVLTTDQFGRATITGDARATQDLIDHAYEVDSTISDDIAAENPVFSRRSDADPNTIEGVKRLESDVLNLANKNLKFKIGTSVVNGTEISMEYNLLDVIHTARGVDNPATAPLVDECKEKLAIALGYNPTAEQLARMDHYQEWLKSTDSVPQLAINAALTVGYEGVKLASFMTKTDLGSYITSVLPGDNKYITYGPNVSPPSFGAIQAGVSGAWDGFMKRYKGD